MSYPPNSIFKVVACEMPDVLFLARVRNPYFNVPSKGGGVGLFSQHLEGHLSIQDLFKRTPKSKFNSLYFFVCEFSNVEVLSHCTKGSLRKSKIWKIKKVIALQQVQSSC